MPAGILSVFAVTSSADIGAGGVSKFSVQEADGSQMTGPHATAVANALTNMYTAIHTLWPASMTWGVQSTYTNMDVVTALVLGSPGIPSVPGPIVGSGSGSGIGGTGARGYWHTSTNHGRRLIRGATYFTPFTGVAYASNNGLTATATGTVQSAMLAYLTAISAAGLVAVVYHRPAKGTFTGGVAAPITGASCNAQPGSLRSRRH